MKGASPVAWSAIAFVLTVGTGASFVRLNARTQVELARYSGTQLAQARATAIERQIDQALAATSAVASAAVASQPGRLARVGGDLLSRFPAVSAVALASADATVMETYPRSSSGLLPVGHALRADPQVGPDVRSSHPDSPYRLLGPYRRERGELVMLAMLRIREDGPGREPKLALALLNVAGLVKAIEPGTLALDGYDYRLSGPGPHGQPVVLAQSSELELADPVDLPVRLPDVEWRLAVAPRPGWTPSVLPIQKWGPTVLGAVLVSAWVYDVLRRPAVLRREVERRTKHLVLAHREATQATRERERAEQKLLHEASHDALTGLPNRAFALGQIGRALEAAARGDRGTPAIVAVGLDRFTVVNESRGPTAGDLLLVGVSRRFRAVLRPDDVLARIGGDEFGVILAEVSDTEAARAVAERLLATLAKPFALEGADVFITASAGIAVAAPATASAESMLRDAGMALRRVKSSGGERVAVFTEEMHAGVMRRTQVETDLRYAIDHGQLVPYFEPVVSLETGRITGFEALARWIHPEQGLISPGVFIPVAEASGLIVQVDRAIWRLAASQIRDLHRRTPRQRHVSISVNLSARHLMEPDLVACVADVLETSGLSPALFRIEITESMMMENASVAVDVMTQLKALGIRLLLDDFGTGYSSLSYLHELPVDVLKIDRSFIDQLAVGEAPVASKHDEIVRTIIQLGQQLGLDVIAEGLSNEDQLCRLHTLDCPHAQGWLFSRPVPADRLDALVMSPRSYTPWHEAADTKPG